MTNQRTYIDIEDFGNTENIVKRIDPAFNDIPSRMPAAVANFAQQQLSMTIRKDGGRRELGGLRGHQLYLLNKMKGK